MSRSELLIRFGEHHLWCLSLASLTTLRCPLDGARIVRITKADQLALLFEGGRGVVAFARILTLVPRRSSVVPTVACRPWGGRRAILGARWCIRFGFHL